MTEFDENRLPTLSDDIAESIVSTEPPVWVAARRRHIERNVRRVGGGHRPLAAFHPASGRYAADVPRSDGTGNARPDSQQKPNPIARENQP